MRPSWIIWVGTKSNHKCPYKGKAEGYLRQKRRHREEEGVIWRQRQKLKWWQLWAKECLESLKARRDRNRLSPRANLLDYKARGVSGCQSGPSKAPVIGNSWANTWAKRISLSCVLTYKHVGFGEASTRAIDPAFKLLPKPTMWRNEHGLWSNHLGFECWPCPRSQSSSGHN